MPTESAHDGRSLVVLNRVMRELLRGGTYDALLDRMMGEVLRGFDAERGYLVVPQGQDLRIRAVRNWTNVEIEGGPGEFSRSIVGDVLASGTAVVLPNAMQSKYGKARSVQEFRIASVLAAPISSSEGQSPRGVLYLEALSSVRTFSKSDLDVLIEILDLAGQVLSSVLRRTDVHPRGALHPEIVTQDPRLLELLEVIERVADTDVPVLIQGESGTGKELFARALHRQSARRDGPFVAINCGAFAESVLESEIFGHVKGAFSGATATRRGVLEQAHGGTLFLDELGEMPLPLQVKLLRAVQFGEIRRVGAEAPIHIDVRYVSATHRPLEADLATGRFRPDLFYRLNCVTLDVPPLRDRKEDVLLLWRHFLEDAAHGQQSPIPDVSDDLLQALCRHDWPGNVRELENEVVRLLALAPRDGSSLTASMLSSRIRRSHSSVPPAPTNLADRVQGSERQAIEEALEAASGNRTHAAKRLGIGRETLRLKMRRYGIT